MQDLDNKSREDLVVLTEEGERRSLAASQEREPMFDQRMRRYKDLIIHSQSVTNFQMKREGKRGLYQHTIA